MMCCTVQYSTHGHIYVGMSVSHIETEKPGDRV